MKKILLILSLLFSFSLFADNMSDWKKMIKEQKAIGLDVRTLAETKLNAAEGSKHLSYFGISKEKIKDLNLDKEKTIMVFCESGGRAGKSVKNLKEAGFKNVINIGDWRTWNKINN